MKKLKCEYNKYLLETKGFSSLAESGFEFWDNPDDDVYEDFYNNIANI